MVKYVRYKSLDIIQFKKGKIYEVLEEDTYRYKLRCELNDFQWDDKIHFEEIKEQEGSTKMKYYAVAKGVETGIFPTWDECFARVNGFTDAKYKKFNNLEDAEDYLKEESEEDVESVMTVESIEIGKGTIVRASSKEYFKKGTLFVFKNDDKNTFLEIIEINLENDLVHYGLHDISYYNSINKMEEPRAMLKDEISLATEEEKKSAYKQRGYM